MHAHHYSVLQNNFIALKSSVLCLFIPPSPHPLATTEIFTVSVVSPFLECHIVVTVRHEPLQIGFFLLVICIEVSSMLLYGLRVHFCLVLNNIPLSGWTAIYPFTSEGLLGGSQVWTIINKSKNKQMGPYETKKLLHSKGNHKQNKMTTLRMGENMCKQSIWQVINFQNIQTACAAQYQKHKPPNQKMGGRSK